MNIKKGKKQDFIYTFKINKILLLHNNLYKLSMFILLLYKLKIKYFQVLSYG